MVALDWDLNAADSGEDSDQCSLRRSDWVDRAALDEALSMGAEIGSWCPKGRAAEDGSITGIYPLTEPSGAVINRNAGRIRILMSSACPHQDLFRTVAFRLNSS